ncbi:maleylacetoacetate isomerase [Mesorhizobium sp. CO1-1-8]|uniref:maleylacetoacetate isomerase n=1 Tax=Mesorhizobium sp. CO1-1-8 TaxID=2876631 RepID=UPI001CD12D03|nr:maleylacetoacetate isomerase [Mesorhizobium sp. CO1-1-8]MBZ9772369.1 maleylacetoacetate isomerase [Mesorhizobium sp. CO1-1-8]
MSDMVLFDYWRSSSSYRVRIALNLLGLSHTTVPVNLLKGEQWAPPNLARNPQGLVPTLRIDGHDFTQSLAIIEYLHEITPGSTLLPNDPSSRSQVRALAYAVAMEIHPICNLSVAAHVQTITGGGEVVRSAWMCKFIRDGLVAVEAMLKRLPVSPFCLGPAPTIADICLIPQIYNADRWGAETSDLTRIRSITAACQELPAFKAAYPHDASQPG